MTFLSNFTLNLDSFNGEREFKGMLTSLTIPSKYVDLEHSVVDSKASRTYVVLTYVDMKTAVITRQYSV